MASETARHTPFLPRDTSFSSFPRPAHSLVSPLSPRFMRTASCTPPPPPISFGLSFPLPSNENHPPSLFFFFDPNVHHYFLRSRFFLLFFTVLQFANGGFLSVPLFFSCSSLESPTPITPFYCSDRPTTTAPFFFRLLLTPTRAGPNSWNDSVVWPPPFLTPSKPRHAPTRFFFALLQL